MKKGSPVVLRFYFTSELLSFLHKWPECAATAYQSVKHPTRVFHVCQRQSAMEQGQSQTQVFSLWKICEAFQYCQCNIMLYYSSTHF
ncbi:hypothetical protein JOQ06_029453 [Pogonophryne albipinna]|uniref:Uncharacterized protein n=1 Tax=Pogonophryne albipinna TaxID=1090488 RepID=A0AAD6BAZ1_9TELE|nr:hypothetical protein JOQ06_029453 [Pogonophryne albipinna]